MTYQLKGQKTTYINLATIEAGQWVYHFGSVDITDVRYERDLCDNAHVRSRMFVTSLSDGQAAIDAALSYFNEA